MEGSNCWGYGYKTQHSYPRWRLITWRRPEVKFGRNVVKKKQNKNYQDEDKKSTINKKLILRLRSLISKWFQLKTITNYYYITPCDFFLHQHQLMVFHKSDSKSSQVFRTLHSILSVLINAVVWMVSACPQIYNSSSPLTKPFETVTKASVILTIIFTTTTNISLQAIFLIPVLTRFLSLEAEWQQVFFELLDSIIETA